MGELNTCLDHVEGFAVSELRKNGRVPFTVTLFINEMKSLVLFPEFRDDNEKHEIYDAMRYLVKRHGVTSYTLTHEAWMSYRTDGSKPSSDPLKVDCLVMYAYAHGYEGTRIRMIDREGEQVKLEPLLLDADIQVNIALHDPSLITTGSLKLGSISDKIRKRWVRLD